MLFQIDIDDADLAYLFDGMRYGSITLNRYSKEDAARIHRLVENGIIEQETYYGDEICYHPTYRLTALGKKVRKQADSVTQSA